MSGNEEELSEASLEASESIETKRIIKLNVIASFSIMEVQFNIMRIRTPIHQFYHMLAAIPQEISMQAITYHFCSQEIVANLKKQL